MKKLNPADFVVNENQTLSSEGGKVFKIDKWKRLERYLIMGTENGTFYACANKTVTESNENLDSCIKEDGIRTAKMIIDISDRGIAPKNDQAIFAFAMCLAKGDPKTKRFVQKNISKVVRTGSHLTQFVDYSNKIRGWGRALRNTIATWYFNLGDRTFDGNLSSLVYQTTKYGNRNGFSHRDILRLSHVKPVSPEHSTIFKWITSPKDIPYLPNEENEVKLKTLNEELFKYALCKNLSNYDKNKVVEFILKYKLPHEVIPSNLKNDVDIWQALFDAGMPLNALIRNLGKLSSLGMTKPLSSNEKKIISLFEDEKYIKQSRIHPLNVLNQMKGYKSGKGRSGLSWDSSSKIVSAMESMFYLAFDNVVPSNKRILIAIDVSGSMTWNSIPGMTLSASEIAAAMAMCTVRTEPYTHIVGFSDTIKDLGITAKMDLEKVLDITRSQTFGATYCEQPMLYAKKNKLEIDAFFTYTDCETWTSDCTVPVALNRYRRSSGIHAKAVTIATESNNISLSDPKDPCMLDVSGFSTDTPAVLSYFLKD